MKLMIYFFMIVISLSLSLIHIHTHILSLNIYIYISLFFFLKKSCFWCCLSLFLTFFFFSITFAYSFFPFLVGVDRGIGRPCSCYFITINPLMFLVSNMIGIEHRRFKESQVMMITLRMTIRHKLT